VQYADSLGTLAEATTRRGKVFHQEQNRQVYVNLQSLATAIHVCPGRHLAPRMLRGLILAQAYGQRLASLYLISRSSTIRTITAGSQIVSAQSVWANNVNYPGK